MWALGVLLYKLCYYTTPFEEHGTLAIVNAKYSFPQYPVYSPRIQHLIGEPLNRLTRWLELTGQHPCWSSSLYGVRRSLTFSEWRTR